MLSVCSVLSLCTAVSWPLIMLPAIVTAACLSGLASVGAFVVPLAGQCDPSMTACRRTCNSNRAGLRMSSSDEGSASSEGGGGGGGEKPFVFPR